VLLKKRALTTLQATAAHEDRAAAVRVLAAGVAVDERDVLDA
jgi:hypothetical protein